MFIQMEDTHDSQQNETFNNQPRQSLPPVNTIVTDTAPQFIDEPSTMFHQMSRTLRMLTKP